MTEEQNLAFIKPWRMREHSRRNHTNLLVLQLLESNFPETNLHFTDYEHDESLSLDQFFLKLFSLANNHYTQSDNKKEICLSGKFRSFIDLFRLCRNYYKCDLYTFLKMLAGIDDISSYWCPDIQRCIIGPNEHMYSSWIKDLNIPAEEFGYRTYPQLLDLLKDIKENNE